MHNILSVQTYSVCNIFLTAGKQNSWLFQQYCFYFGGEYKFQLFCENMENNSTLRRVLLVCNRNAELLRLVEDNFWFQSVRNATKDEKEKFDNSEKFTEKKFAIYCFICLLLLTFELSNINWKCLENCNLLTKRTYESAVFKIFLNIITICVFIEQ